MKTFYITTPIFYPNAKPHVGHAYTTTISDVLARYHRQRIGKNNVYFLTGTDENTEKVVRAARAIGEDPKVYLNEIVEEFRRLYADIDISYDQFIRTTDEKIHWPGAQELWKRIAAKGDLELKSYSGLYCTGHEAFLTEKDLIDGKCPDHDEVPEKVEEENYFFKLSIYTSEIKKKIESDELRIIPQSRKNEILSLLSSGFEDISFSRPAEKMTFGIPVPDDPTQKMYVWCDALSSYITSLGFGRGGELMHFWPGIHVIGKDILRFHAAIWPGMLLSAGLPLPKTILVHGFITSGGKKMSKTLGNIIDPEELVDDYGPAALRYYLIRHILPFEDGDITKEGFKEVYNANLANGLGNLVRRIMQMAVSNNVHYIIPPTTTIESLLTDKKMLPIQKLLNEYENRFRLYNVSAAFDVLWRRDYDGGIGWMDWFITKYEPYKEVKTKPLEGQKKIYYLLERLFYMSVLLGPFLPETSREMFNAIKESKVPLLFPRKE